MKSKSLRNQIFSGFAGAIFTGIIALFLAFYNSGDSQSTEQANNESSFNQREMEQTIRDNAELEEQLDSISKELRNVESRNLELTEQLEKIQTTVSTDSENHNDATSSYDIIESESSSNYSIIESDDSVKLCDMKISEYRYFEIAGDFPQEDTVGNKYNSTNNFIIRAQGTEGYGYATFYTGNKYSSISGIIAVSDESEIRDDVSLKGWIGIFVKQNDSYELIYSTDELSRETSQVIVSDVDISNSEWVQIRYYNQAEYFNLAQGYHSLKVLLSEFQINK